MSFSCRPAARTINDLPPEMLQEILRPLRLIDLIELKLVCKLWNELISRMKINRLFVDADLLTRERWYYTNRPSTGDVCCPDLFVAHCKQPMLSNLKYLRLDYEVWDNQAKKMKVIDFDPNEINHFRQLIQLDIEHYEAGPLELRLPNLEILSMNWYHNKNPGGCSFALSFDLFQQLTNFIPFINLHHTVYVDCPKVRILGYCEFSENDNLRLESYELIRMLDSPILGAKLARFRNLEVLRCTEYDQGFLDRSTLLNLPKLKVIYSGIGFGNYDIGNFQPDVLQRLKEFMRQKRILRRDDLKVYFAGVLLIDEDLADIDFGLEQREGRDFISPEQLYMKHYHRLQDQLDFVVNVDYSRLFSLVDVLPDDYFHRFLNLKGVKAFCPLNERHFLAFLRQIYSLEWFSIYNSDLSQAFFDCLPEFCSLTNFYLFETDDNLSALGEPAGSSNKSEMQLDLSFLGKFKRLCFVQIERDLSLLSLRTFVASFEPMMNMYENTWPFQFKKKHYKIMKVFSGRKVHSYSLMTSKSETLLEGVSLAEVVDHLVQPWLADLQEQGPENQIKRFRRT